jgi:hypothetical protein
MIARSARPPIATRGAVRVRRVVAPEARVRASARLAHLTSLAIALALLGVGCRYGSDEIVPPRGGWPTDASADVATEADTAAEAAADSATDAIVEASVDAAADVVPEADAAPLDARGDGGPCGVTINEVMTRGATADDEFVELYNACGAPFTFPDDTTLSIPTNGGFGQTNVVALGGRTIAPFGFLLFVGNGYTGAAKADGLLADGSDQLSSAGGGVAIFHGVVRYDAVGWGALTRVEFHEGGALVAGPASGTSLARRPDGFDTNVNVADFAVDRPPSPGASNP